MSKFIGKNEIDLLNIEDMVKEIYMPYNSKEKDNLDNLISYIKNKRFKEFLDKLQETNINFKNKDILTHKIDLNNIIYPYKYLSRGAYGATFLAKLKKRKKGKETGDKEFFVVKYEIVRDRDYERCQDEYMKCIDKNKDQEQRCKVKEVYCRLDSAFIEIYINKNYIEKLNSRNFAMFYAFFMCPTFKILFDKSGKYPKDEFLNKFIENKKFCVECKDTNLESEKMHVFSVYEYIPGKTLSKYIESKSFNLNALYKIFLQLFGALSSAQIPNKVFYNHNDLHTNNIMIQNYQKTQKYTYFLPLQKTKNSVLSNKRAVIIDQGNASLICKEKYSENYNGVFGWYKKSISKVIKNYNSPYADVFRVITDSYSRMLDFNKNNDAIRNLKKIINDLFSLNSYQQEYGLFDIFKSFNSVNPSTICSDFMENEQEVWFDRYVLYLEKNLSKENFSTLMKKIEKITYEFAFNYFNTVQSSSKP